MTGLPQASLDNSVVLIGINTYQINDGDLPGVDVVAMKSVVLTGGVVAVVVVVVVVGVTVVGVVILVVVVVIGLVIEVFVSIKIPNESLYCFSNTQ